jgi:hypothetical protein
MKKIVFTLALSVFFFQLAGVSQVKVGVLGGVSIAKMEGNINGDRRAGLMASMVLDADLGRNFSFYPTLSYVQKGVTEPHPAGTLIDKQYVALRYAELSTNFIYHIGNPDGNSFFLGLGPSIDFNMPSKRTSVTDDTKTSSDILFGPTPENDLKGVDFGANVVLGWRMAGGFAMTLNWNKGIRDLKVEGQTLETKNQYIGIQIGMFIK